MHLLFHEKYLMCLQAWKWTNDRQRRWKAWWQLATLTILFLMLLRFQTILNLLFVRKNIVLVHNYLEDCS